MWEARAKEPRLENKGSATLGGIIQTWKDSGLGVARRKANQPWPMGFSLVALMGVKVNGVF